MPRTKTIYILNFLGHPFYRLLIFTLNLLTKIKSKFLILGFIFLSIFVYFKIFYRLPNPQDLINTPSKLTTQILDRNGRLLYKIYQQENRTLININQLPPYVINAFLTAEDSSFYQHHGFSFKSFFRALGKNFELVIFKCHFSLKNCPLEGGSTITQQLIKNTLLTPQKNLTRKIKELILSLKTERLFNKNTILEMYLNQVGFGGPAYGIQEASQQYFSENAKDLSLAQAAFLAGLTKAPSKYSPFGAYPNQAIKRQHLILSQMAEAHLITSEELEISLKTPLKLTPLKIEINAPHFVMYVKDLLANQFGEQLVNQGGLIVTTSLDLNLQQKFQSFITDEANKLLPLNITNGAGLITNPKTGEILSMVGSKDYFNSSIDGNVNLTTSPRQPGSSIKPINYALAFENGLTPSSVINDTPITINQPGSETWSPKNYDHVFHGPITLRRALASSYNIPSVLLAVKNGINNLVRLAQKMGITTWDDPQRYGPAVALGSLEVKMTDLAQSYSSFANQGVSVPLNPILSITTSKGKTIKFDLCHSSPNCVPTQTIKPETAKSITDILSDNSARAPAFGQNSNLNIKKAKVAVKTGTSNDFRDNWTIGYTDNFLVATWVGNNDNSPMSQVVSGITGAAPIWAKTVNFLLNK